MKFPLMNFLAGTWTFNNLFYPSFTYLSVNKVKTPTSSFPPNHKPAETQHMAQHYLTKHSLEHRPYLCWSRWQCGGGRTSWECGIWKELGQCYLDDDVSNPVQCYWVISSCLSAYLRRWMDRNCWVRYTTEFSEERPPRGFLVFKLRTLNSRENDVKPEEIFTFFWPGEPRRWDVAAFGSSNEPSAEFVNSQTECGCERQWCGLKVGPQKMSSAAVFFVIQMDLCEIFLNSEKLCVEPGRCFFSFTLPLHLSQTYILIIVNTYS